MRRKEREVTDIEEIRDVLNKSFALHLGLNDNGHVYVVPVNFGYAEENGRYTFYFHGAKDGRKYNLMKDGALAGFECEADYSLKAGEKACEYSAYYASVIGEGRVSTVEDNEEKKAALNLIMKKATGKGDWNYPAIMLARVAVFRLEADELTCKSHKR
jgi:uncharacterized protein